jgi:hypothetical protein
MRTKVTVILLVVVLVCPIASKAQRFTTGLSVGISTTSVKFSDISNAFTNAINGKNIIGGEIGAFARLNMDIFFIKPMILLNFHTGNVDIYNNNGSVNSSGFNYGKTLIPILFGVKILRQLRIEAGPVYNLVYASSYSYDNVVKMGTSGFGYRIGANIEFERINFGFTYQGLTNKSTGTGAATFSSPNELIFSVAFCLRNRL